MKKMIRRITAACMTFVILSVTPLNDVAPGCATEPDTAKAAESTSGGKYITDVRIGMGETADEAKNELEKDGYTILKDDAGNYADINEGAGSKSVLKRGANDKKVYLGYKTTDDANDAITDLAVMNMLGGYSITDYDDLMEKHMNSHVRPFVDNFIAALEEYRENYKKPEGSLGHIRAESMRKTLNKLTDDDTDGKPLGDLLLNKTKYELGDDAYNALSDTEKKEHADILTILMEANGQAVLTMEMLITKATDTSDDTWIDRLADTTLDDLTERIQSEDPNLLSASDVNAALDRKYYDKAKRLLEKWKPFHDEIMKKEDTIDELADDQERVDGIIEKARKIGGDDISESEAETIKEAGRTLLDQVYDLRSVGICEYLGSITYNDGTLLDYFSVDYSEISTQTGIRRLYPMVDALSPGQIAGLDFLSFDDLISMAASDEETYKVFEESLGSVDAASVYEGVDRDIYEKGAVAITSDRMRKESAKPEDFQPASYTMGTLPITLFSVTGGLLVATAVVGKIANVARANQYVQRLFNGFGNLQERIAFLNVQLKSGIFRVAGYEGYGVGALREVNALKAYSLYSRLAIGMAVIAVIAVAVSTVFTVIDAIKQYDVDFKEIPKFMVDSVDVTDTDSAGNIIMKKNEAAYYRVALCNRSEGEGSIEKKNYEKMKDRADLNGDIGREWLALYWIKSNNMKPILADSLLYRINDSGLPDGYSSGIHEFGSPTACNLNRKAYLFPDDPPSIKVFYKTGSDTVKQLMGSAAGSIFSPGSLAFGVGIGMIVGALFMGLIMWRRRVGLQPKGK